MSEGGLRLRKWNFNSASLIGEIVKLEVPNNQAQQGRKTCDFPDVTKENDKSYTKWSTSLSSPTSSDRKTGKVLGVNVENNQTLCRRDPTNDSKERLEILSWRAESCWLTFTWVASKWNGRQLYVVVWPSIPTIAWRRVASRASYGQYQWSCTLRSRQKPTKCNPQSKSILLKSSIVNKSALLTAYCMWHHTYYDLLIS